MDGKSKVSIALSVFAVLSIGIAFVVYQPVFTQLLSVQPKLYTSADPELKKRFDADRTIALQWSQLLPDTEKSVLKKYQQQQANTPTQFADNILLSLEASTDIEYSAAMISTNSVDTFDQQSISIAGFIVPIDYAEDRSLRNIFIVPYFGACLHFPPPPPNQILFAQLDEGFSDFDLSQAYRLNGILRRGLFEDPIGTSAYILDVVSIEAFFENPDDFRQH